MKQSLKTITGSAQQLAKYLQKIEDDKALFLFGDLANTIENVKEELRTLRLKYAVKDGRVHFKPKHIQFLLEEILGEKGQQNGTN